jgi:membrane protease YdiL (CAAX protease family)
VRSKGQSSRIDATPLAPGWHTAALIALYVLVATAGLALSSAGAVPPPHSHSRLVATYAPLVFVELALLVYVVRVGRPASALSALVGRKWTSARRAVVDVALAAASFLSIRVFDFAWARVFVLGRSAAEAVLPVSGLERAAWVLVAVTVGVSEEIVFRGYLQTQLGAFTRRAALGVVLQALLFGLAHAEQGPEAMARIAIYGLGLGVLAHLRRSLLPGILCHVATDVVSGLIHR